MSVFTIIVLMIGTFFFVISPPEVRNEAIQSWLRFVRWMAIVVAVGLILIVLGNLLG